MNRTRLGRRGAAAVLVLASAAGLVVATQSANAGRTSYGVGSGIALQRGQQAAAPKPAAPATSSVTPSRAASPASSTTVAPPAPAGSTSGSTATATSSGPFLGTLITHSDTAAQESRAGLKMAMLEFSWRTFEPQRGVFNRSYGSWMVTQLQRFREAGMKVTLGLGLHYAPAWALAIAGSRLVDQYGNTSGQLDLIFNQTLRQAANEYVTEIDRTVGLENFWAIRISAGGQSELLYPSTAYWAYSAGAQNGPTMPTTMARNPMPGWRPGNGATQDQRARWAAWYLAALDDVAKWQMDLATTLGFGGYFQILTPGQGLRPTHYAKAVSDGLPDGLLGRGAVWQVVYANLQGRPRITAFVTSVADGSSGNDVCQSTDRDAALGSGTAYYWSATRWISRVAQEFGFTVGGEIPGYPTTTAGQARYRDASAGGLLAQAMAQARGCGFTGLYWAHDDQVWDGTMPLDRLAAQTSPQALAPADAR